MTKQRSARAKGLWVYPKYIGKTLGPWWYDDASAVEALRGTPGSGTVGKHVKDLAGDMSPVGKWNGKKPEWILCIELKHRVEWSWDNFMKDPSKSKISEYWDQVVSDSITDENICAVHKWRAYPVLIFTKNYSPDFIMVSGDFENPMPDNCAHIQAKIDDQVVFCARYNEFLKYVKPSKILEITSGLLCKEQQCDGR